MNARKHLILILLAGALLLRLCHWLAVREEPFFAHLVMDSQEYHRWAREIAAGEWLGREPFFQAPLYPYFLGLLYAVFGAHLDLVYLIQILLAVAGCYALYRAGCRYGGEGVGLGAAALAATYGPFLFYDVQILKESLAVTLAAFLLWVLALGMERPGVRWWLGAGGLAGLLTLLRENMLLVVLFLLPLVFLRRGEGHRWPVRLGGLLLGLALVLGPVALRNAWLGGGFLPTTFQGGVNFYIGNNPEADGTYQPIVPGKQIPAYERREPVRLAEEALGRRLSAAEVSRYWFARALAWAREEPLAFLRLQLRKLAMFWSWYEWPDAVDYYYVKTRSPVLRLPLVGFGAVSLLALLGLVLRRRRLARWTPVLLFILGWMASTVLFFLFSRYRLPAVPGLLLLAAVPLAAAAEAWQRRERRRAVVLSVACLAALVAPHLRPFQPRMDLVHYNLALVEEGRGRPEAAAEHYRQALEHNPQDFLARLNLGNQAARAGRWEEARSWYQEAVAIEPRSDDAWSNLGGVYLAMGRLDEAARHLERALELNPKSATALHNLALVRLRQGDLEAAKDLNRKVLTLDPDHPQARRLRERLLQGPQ